MSAREFQLLSAEFDRIGAAGNCTRQCAFALTQIVIIGQSVFQLSERAQRVSDVLLARHVLPSRAAAVYAAGSIVTKGTLWLPQSVANVLFASLVDSERHRAVYVRAVAGIAGMAAAIALCCWPFGWIAARVVAGNRYPELGSVIWQFAVLGGCLAIVQFTLVAGLAVRNLGVIVLIWLTVAAETIGVFSLGAHPTVRAVISLIDVINLVSAAAAVGLRLRPGARAAPPAAVGIDPAGAGPV